MLQQEEQKQYILITRKQSVEMILLSVQVYAKLLGYCQNDSLLNY